MTGRFGSRGIRIREGLHTRLRSTRAAIDLASIMVGVLIIGIVGGVIFATVFAVIPWAQDQAAKQSLGAVTTAEAVAKVKDSAYLDGAGLHTAKYLNPPASLTVKTDAGICWVAVSKSATGRHFMASNDTANITELHAGEATPCADVSVRPAFAATVDSVPSLMAAFAAAKSGDVIGVTGDFSRAPAEEDVAAPVGKNLTLDLNGHTVTIDGDHGDNMGGHVGIAVPTGTTLTFADRVGTGKLTARGYYGAGIGADYCYGSSDTDCAGAPSGMGAIIIEGANIHAIGAGRDGAGIGGTSNPLVDAGSITILAGNVTAEGADSAAGIGGGYGSQTPRITISGGNILAQAGTSGASGIGAGRTAVAGGSTNLISITGGIVIAHATSGAADIGGPDATVSITGGTVNGTAH